ncbi:MAG: MG(2+) CHELATASE FAMILY PROTEIN / ComM-related protein [uncultured Thiotrichaceae bacterium]|uniref:MG(2+) CHELATASE FAMILY PROTEIN / ComM-related protein n=1 Tax=uncultured Thiotrichaceae bacterium TaxID=298394 RepID=A0A6S6U049_9GAMM|nr:MAG: MG(2+) CHELATASE FAMILY PROTEIN / ComM-related protein [uncultured Thiotrichaceae bacterium]
MPLAIIYSRTNNGIDAALVCVEVDIANGLPSLSIVGLPEAAVKESKDRVRAAIINSRFEFPAKRITVNLAPADIPKDGGRLDLPIAIGILAASEQIPMETLDRFEFIGELSLGGQVRPVKGVLPTAYAANQARRTLVVAMDNADEASLIKALNVIAIQHLGQFTAHILGIEVISSFQSTLKTKSSDNSVDMRDVKGQHHAKRALEIAAAGGHNMLMVGPPGTGKTMLASRLATIMPPMTEQEALESATIASISNQGFDVEKWSLRPIRAPHHTASGVALVGGGAKVKPGEISLAHNGVLFLDELMEFDRKVLEVLREPLENGAISISRAARQATYPAKFQLICAFNFCPQGLSCDLQQDCQCSQEQKRRYLSKLSAPFLDRIDLHIEVPRLPRQDLQSAESGETSESVRERVIAARTRQIQRQHKNNRSLTNQDIERVCILNDSDSQLLAHAMDKFRFSARTYHRILKVARTIADLDESAEINTQYLMEALSYRSLPLFENPTQQVAL